MSNRKLRNVSVGRRRSLSVPRVAKTWAEIKQLALTEPVIITHRGAGENLAIDGALSSLDFAVAQGMNDRMVLDGGDNRLTSGGAMVVSHDPDTGILMDQNISVAAQSEATFKSLKFRDFPLHRGTISSESPPTTIEYLQKCKDLGYFTVPEDKVGGAMPGKLVTAIQNLGMTNTVQVQAFEAGYLQAADAAGISVGLLQSGARNIGFPAILTCINGHAPDLVLYNPADDPGDAYLQQAINAGIALQCGTIERRHTLDTQRARVAAMGGNLTLIPSDDPFYLGRRIAPRTTDRFKTQQWEHGLVYSALGQKPRIIDGKLQYLNTAGTQWALLGFFSSDVSFKTMEFDIIFETLDTNTSRWGGIFWGVADDRQMHDGDNNSPGSLSFLLRQTGEMIITNRTSTSTTTQAATTVAGGAGTRSSSTLTPVVQGQRIRMKIENYTDASGTFTNQCRLTRLDTGEWIQSAVGAAPLRGGYVHAGKNGTTGGTVSFSEFQVTY